MSLIDAAFCPARYEWLDEDGVERISVCMLPYDHDGTLHMGDRVRWARKQTTFYATPEGRRAREIAPMGYDHE